MVSVVKDAVAKCGLHWIEKETPFPWGEDFGIFTQAFPGVIFGLGAGRDTPALHHESYDFPDDLIETGVSVFESIADLVLEDV